MKLDNIKEEVIHDYENLRKKNETKIVCSPSYADFRSRAKYSNVVGLGSHAKGTAHTGGMRIGKKPKTL
jgi:hypothetical protein